MTASFDFRGKVALITGGSKGIGRAIAEDFLAVGGSVSVCARGKVELEKFQAQHKSSRLLTVSADTTEEEEVEKTIQTTIERFGQLDILVNNVGGAIEFGDFWKLSNESWKKAFELNVLSMVNFSKQAVPFLKRSSSPRIINVSSISGVEPGYYNPHYTSTKASTINFSKYLANLLASDNILVNTVCPGTVETDSWSKSVEQISHERSQPVEQVAKEMTLKEIAKIPLGRQGQCQDISPLVLFLASEQAGWITGSCFHVNGGKLRAMC